MEGLPFQLLQLEQGLVPPQQGAPPRKREVCMMLGPGLAASAGDSELVKGTQSLCPEPASSLLQGIIPWNASLSS